MVRTEADLVDLAAFMAGRAAAQVAFAVVAAAFRAAAVPVVFS